MTNKPSKKDLREFGLLLGIGFPLLIGWIIPLFLGHEFRAWTLWLSLPSLTLGITYPKALKFPYRLWMLLGHGLGLINSRIILGLILLK